MEILVVSSTRCGVHYGVAEVSQGPSIGGCLVVLQFRRPLVAQPLQYSDTGRQFLVIRHPCQRDPEDSSRLQPDVVAHLSLDSLGKPVCQFADRLVVEQVQCLGCDNRDRSLDAVGAHPRQVKVLQQG